MSPRGPAPGPGDVAGQPGPGRAAVARTVGPSALRHPYEGFLGPRRVRPPSAPSLSG